MQKCQPRGSVHWTLISVIAMMASSGVVKAACVAGVERGGGGKGRNPRGWRKGEEGSHADLPGLFYNFVECKLTNTNFEYFNDTN